MRLDAGHWSGLPLRYGPGAAAEARYVRHRMTLRAILFDLDGTLHDKTATLRAVAARQYSSADLASRHIAYETWQSSFVELNNLRIEKTEVFSRLAQLFGLPRSFQASLLEDFDENLGKLAVAFPGAVDLLGVCRGKGLKVGVVTNGRDAFQRSKIEGMGLSPYLDAVVTSGAFGSKKPDPKIFLACLSQLGVPPRQAVFVGDDLQADIEPSLQLGMRAILKAASPSPRVWLCTESLPEIAAFIQSHA
ncbi:HAD family hydrolase [Sorangium atrum]|uniref:HAD family hydrolase n=1 Tax=Sorangium atrum TaxID=2995308 RepID=A0ABT5BUN4_9BACT|nr:HAD family hydrolase [Sorangium aterium]MDC0677869.1 HAD family hydrolase [Sorangium aterium]